MEKRQRKRRRHRRYKLWVVLLPLTVSLVLAGGLLYFGLGLQEPAGWIRQDGMICYRDEEGQLLTGWQEIDGRRYCFREDGAMLTGWQMMDGNRYYLDQSGETAIGWQTVDGDTYYFREDGAASTGWQNVDGLRRYFSREGKAWTGWLEESGDRYYLWDDFSPVTGWQTVDGTLRYFGENGVLARGLTDTGDGLYCFDAEGNRITGWVTLGEYAYYFLEDGRAATQPTVLDGETFYFSPHGVHVLLVNPWHSLPRDYSVELVNYGENFRIAQVCADALKTMLRDCAAAGNAAAICSAYRSQADQEYLFQRKLQTYLDQGYSQEEGRLLAGTIVAVPGTSEHQLGLAVDLVDVNNWNLDESQASMPAQQWLMEHSWEYGFILRYPNGTSEITGIIYEPWHYRYVGVEIAREIRELGVTLEEYLNAVL